eukprot:scpid3758/ scgid34217/ 
MAGEEKCYQEPILEEEEDGGGGWIMVDRPVTSSTGETTVNEPTQLASPTMPIPVPGLVCAEKVTSCECGKPRLESRITCQLCSSKTEPVAVKSRSRKGSSFARGSIPPPCFSSSSSPSSPCSPPALIPPKKPGYGVVVLAPMPGRSTTWQARTTPSDTDTTQVSGSSSAGASTPRQVESRSNNSTTLDPSQAATSRNPPSGGLCSVHGGATPPREQLEPIPAKPRRTVRPARRRRSAAVQCRDATEWASSASPSSPLSSPCEFCPGFTTRMSRMRVADGTSVSQNRTNNSLVQVSIPDGGFALIFYPTRETDPIALASPNGASHASTLLNGGLACGTPSAIRREVDPAAAQLFPPIHQQSTTLARRHACSETRPSDDHPSVERTAQVALAGPLAERATLHRSESLGALPQSRPRQPLASQRCRPSTAAAPRPLQEDPVTESHIAEGTA